MNHLRLLVIALSTIGFCGSCAERAAPAGSAGGSPPSTSSASTPPAAAPAEPAPAPSAPLPVTPPQPTPPPDTKPVETKPAETKPAAVTPIDEATAKWFITVERAKELYDAKEIDGRQVIFIDARTFLEFRDEGHIRGAMHYATAYTRGAPQPKVRNYLPGSAIVIYCHGELCTDSVEVGRYFESLKLEIGPVFIIKAGFPGWKNAYPNLVDRGNEIGFD